VEQRVKPIADVPLIVDLDGTLIKVDSLHEAFVQLCSKKPLSAFRAMLMLIRGRAEFKSAVADHVLPDVATIPLNEAVLEIIRQAKAEGRKVYLASAADRRFVEAIANSIGAFDGIFGSQDGVNLKGKAKADCLINAYGRRGFDYLGNDTSDLPVWHAARRAMVVGAPSRLVKRLGAELPGSIVVAKHHRTVGAYLLALRPHQWLKNILLALPAIAAHDFSVGKAIVVLAAFMSFSLAASVVYLINDMLDLPHDRAHSEKRHRSLAAGAVPLSHAVVLTGLLSMLAIGLALTLPPIFGVILIAYFGFSMSYSLYLKRKLMIDVIALAALYGIRVMAGSAATSTVLSHWLIGFCFFMFLSLALVKRLSEVMAVAQSSVDNIKGRGYRREDLQVIIALTAASGFAAILVFALYITSPEVRALYRSPELLWGICIVLVYWLGRAYLLAGRGTMHQDPVIFAATDRASLLAGVMVALVFLVAL
jgi:4-hydroxybenzoate polyprenyltransferase/phosphoserine phosphatase